MHEATAPDHKQAAIDFLQLIIDNKVREAYSKYAAPDFRHHNPYFAGDVESLITAMEENGRENPNKVCSIKHALQDGEFVAVHSHVKQKPDDVGMAVVHMFRFSGQRITEFWDIAQAIPEDSPNQNGMF